MIGGQGQTVEVLGRLFTHGQVAPPAQLTIGESAHQDRALLLVPPAQAEFGLGAGAFTGHQK